MYIDKDVGIVTLMAEFSERDINLAKAERFIGLKLDRSNFIIYSEIVKRALVEIEIDLNGEIYNGSYILDVIPGNCNSLKLVYLPPLPWNKYTHNKELFDIKEADVKKLMRKTLKAITNLSQNEINESIGYSNL